MKKQLPLFLCLFVSFNTLSQLLTPRAGVAVSSSSIKQNADAQNENIVSVAVGLGYEKKLKSSLWLQVELNYESKGYKYHFEGTINNDPNFEIVSNHTVRHDYLVIPVLAKNYFAKERFFVNGGFYSGIGLGGKHTGSSNSYFNGTISGSQKFNGDVKYGESSGNPDDIYYDKRLDYGLVFGCGVLMFKAIGIDVRYELGLVNIVSSINSKNRSLQVSLLYPIRLSR
jgi:hypothetical protein